MDNFLADDVLAGEGPLSVVIVVVVVAIVVVIVIVWEEEEEEGTGGELPRQAEEEG